MNIMIMQGKKYEAFFRFCDDFSTPVFLGVVEICDWVWGDDDDEFDDGDEYSGNGGGGGGYTPPPPIVTHKKTAAQIKSAATIAVNAVINTDPPGIQSARCNEGV